MLHLFIINPVATKVKGRVNDFIAKIKACFNHSGHDGLYAIHVTKWSRDAVGYVRRFVSGNADNTVRVHSIGGSGTLYEVVNGVFGLPNAQVAAYPLGSSNDFIQYFGRKNMKHFESIQSQITSDTMQIDVMTDGTNYGVANFLVGLEAEAYIMGSAFGKKVRLTSDLWPKLAAALELFKGKYTGGQYNVRLDGDRRIDGKYMSIMTANTPCYQKKMNPAIDAVPHDGLLDVYTSKAVNRWKFLKAIPAYTKGKYNRLPNIFSHYTCSQISINCDRIMHTCFDGEVLFTKSITFQVLPSAITLVVPKQINVSALPAIYQG